MTEYVKRCGSPAALASAWILSRVHLIAPYGMSASGGPCWGAMPGSAAGSTHQVSPYVGPRPGEIGWPFHGACANACPAR